MRLHFYGTRGYVEARSRSHSGHSAFTVESAGFRLLCDYGQNRKGRLTKIAPDAVFVSHGHPDHAWGLAEGTSAPVLSSEVTHGLMAEYPLENRVILEPGRPERVGPFGLTTFPVVHSIRCPGVAVRIETPEGAIVYSGDIVAFASPADAALALGGAVLYVGDGSTLTGSLVRRHPSGQLLGHTTVRAQLGWLASAGVSRAVFSHFGEEPIAMGDRDLRAALEDLARTRAPGCEVFAARDGWTLEL